MSFTTFIGATSVRANCLILGENERPSNFCVLESVEGKIVDKNTAIIVNQRLMQEGYFGGLKVPAIKLEFLQKLRYSKNINGSNPDKPLIL